MIILLFYAAFVWYFCFRWRRHWLGFLSVAIGLGLVALTSYAVDVVKLWFTHAGDGGVDTRLFHMLLGVEAAIVGVVGFFFACLPRESPEKPCRRCRYELSGLDESNPTCPECGLPFAAAKVRPRTCVQCGRACMLEAGRDQCDACRYPRASPGEGVNAGSDASTLPPGAPAPVAR